MKFYKWAALAAVMAVIIGWLIGGVGVAFIVAIIIVIEISLSFDNAVVNARVLQNWEQRWRGRFLKWGMLVAVLGMRIIFPLAIVSATTGIGPISVINMALYSPSKYAENLTAVHHQVAGFGGAFLLLVALDFFFAEKHVYWLEAIETRLTRLGAITGVAVAIVLTTLAIISKCFVDSIHGQQFFMAGVWGIVAYVVANGIGSVIEESEDNSNLGSGIIRAGLAGFFYLELLDASFSFDSTIGAFAISNYLPVIALGLGVGALFVRSMTLHLVEAGTLAKYCYLEHGAFYAILAFAMLLFASGLGFSPPEWITGILGASFIGVAFLHSFIVNRRQLENVV